MRRSRTSALRPLVLASVLALVLASVLAPNDAPAQTSPAPRQNGSASGREGYDVYVTSEHDLVDAVTTTREISEDDMRQESARTVDEALYDQPSMLVRTGGDGEPRLDVRGLR